MTGDTAVRRKRLIEVAFPLEEVSAHSRREKNVRHGHISTLHIWWARRPLAACRAFIYESLIDDPEDDRDREELLKEVADLASWDAVRKPELVVRSREQGGSGLTGTDLLRRARQRILDCNGGKPPRLLDPFAGGGSIPLEALRLGCEVEASDLNPVAVLILKGTVEYPQKYGRPLAEQRAALASGERPADWGIAGVDGQVPEYIREAARLLKTGDGDPAPDPRRRLRRGEARLALDPESEAVAAYEKNPLAADVRYWGNWMLERAREELAQFYPPDPDGSVPVAYLWSRTVPCPNCGAEMPLIRQYWLARKEKKKVALKPVLDRVDNRVDFEVVEGDNVTGDPGEATTSRGDTLCLLCRQVVKAEYVREAGRDGKMGAVMTAVVTEGLGGGAKGYRASRPGDLATPTLAQKRLASAEPTPGVELTFAPDEPIDPRTLGLRVDAFGIDTWSKLFGPRQLLAAGTLAGLVHKAADGMLHRGLEEPYIKIVATYLGLALGRLISYNCTLSLWIPLDGNSGNALGRQALPMVWDYCEINPLVSTSGSWSQALFWIGLYLDQATDIPALPMVNVTEADARLPRPSASAVVTDPPYYDAIDYAGLSDFYYVWLKRSLGTHTPGGSAILPLTPKRDQAIMASESGDPKERERYLGLMRQAFTAISSSLETGGMTGIVFAHANPDAWATLIDGLLEAGLVPYSSWPIDTEREGKLSAALRANLKTSVWMACRPRDADAGEAFLGDVLDEMRPVIRERLLYFWSKGIRGADFFISAIGPALSVFGRHTRVLRPDGSEVTVRDFLDLVRRESTQVALEQVLQGADLGVVDPLTRQYVTWVWSYSRAPLEAGEAIALCLATGASYADSVRPHSIAVEAREKSKKVAKLRTVRERGGDDESLGEDNPARPAPLIDQLQRAAFLWSLNRTADLSGYRQQLGEPRWLALRTLGQAVADCLPDGDEDRRLINGLLGSGVMGTNLTPRPPSPRGKGESQPTAGAELPGFEPA